MVEAESGNVGSEPFRLADGEVGEATVFHCALCGARFTHGRQTCARCPLHAGCNLVTCPACGYGFPRSSWLLDRLARWSARLRTRR